MNPISSQVWQWQGQSIHYQVAGDGVAILLIHGFGASVGHWRKNIPDLATKYQVYAIDLLGFGASAKPKPSTNLTYTFETWGQQIAAFCAEIVGAPVILVGNSIGAIVAMQAAVYLPELVTKVVLINCSLRLLHQSKQAELPWYRRIGSRLVQRLLQNRAIAQIFFDQIRQPQAIRNILKQAYFQSQAITPELIDILLKPAFDPNAVDVFVAFISYSYGPTPEQLLEILPCKAVILWGEQDPWEPIALGRAFQQYSSVQDFIPIPDAGHCPQDEVPEVVNGILLSLT
ncbi:MAG: alpha/beta fold hydrolase [Pseudanabaenaceae cyanobacterium bins.68]|nr:alpha/beta fold hydrolase [Pseudanabaenaceae cyanobacterium bins.68]